MSEDVKILSKKMDRVISLLEVLVIQNERGTYSYDENTDDTTPPPLLTPIAPIFPNNPVEDAETTCPKCSMKFKGIMGYVCTNVGCPMGCGPVTC